MPRSGRGTRSRRPPRARGPPSSGMESLEAPAVGEGSAHRAQELLLVVDPAVLQPPLRVGRVVGFVVPVVVVPGPASPVLGGVPRPRALGAPSPRGCVTVHRTCGEHGGGTGGLGGGRGTGTGDSHAAVRGPTARWWAGRGRGGPGRCARGRGPAAQRNPSVSWGPTRAHVTRQCGFSARAWKNVLRPQQGSRGEKGRGRARADP